VSRCEVSTCLAGSSRVRADKIARSGHEGRGNLAGKDRDFVA
jgi:hypothetical protein